jgi:opacity protein-like surface antigen
MSLRAQSAWDRLYARLSLGANWMEDAELKEFFGPVAPGSKAKFDLGTHTLTTVGYKLNDWASVEADLGSSQNGINGISGGSADNASLSTLALLFNGKLRWPNRTRFIPYLGAGVGPSGMFLNADRLELNGIRTSGFGYDVVFQYQAMAGVRCALSRKLGLSLEYRYSGMESSDYRMSDIVSPAGRASDHVRLGPLEAHSLSLALDANF